MRVYPAWPMASSWCTASRPGILLSAALASSSRNVLQSFSLEQPATQAAADAIAQQLITSSYMVWPQYFDAECVEQLLDTFNEHSFTSAGIGRNSQSQPQVRSSELYWLSDDDETHKKTAAEGSLVAHVESLRERLSQSCDLLLEPGDTELMYARYPPGGFYARHNDVFREAAGRATSTLLDPVRKISFIVYLSNQIWDEQHGGCLRMWPPRPYDEYRHDDDTIWRSADDCIDIAPRAGTLVCFDSTIDHEVLPTTVTRCAVIGWFRSRIHSGKPVWNPYVPPARSHAM